MIMQRKILCVSLLLGTLGGCSWLSDDEGWFVDRRDDYIDAEQLPPLQVPGDMAATPLQDPFPIPPLAERNNPQYFPNRPPLPNAIYADDSRREVRIQRLADRRWLVIPEQPNTVWPKLKQFLAENGMNVVAEIPEAGRLDTAWFDVESRTNKQYRDVVRIVIQEGREKVGLSTGRDRLRMKLERGLQPETSEIHLRYENDSMASPSADGLASLAGVTSAVPQFEGDLLNEIGAYIASRVSEQTVSKVATNIAGTNKAMLGRNNAGQPALHLRLDRQRAWAAVGRALENGAVEVLDAQEEDGVYAVRVDEQLFTGEDSPGFFNRIFGRGRSGAQELSLRLIGEEENLELTVHEPDGGYAERQLSQDLLTLVREFAG